MIELYSTIQTNANLFTIGNIATTSKTRYFKNAEFNMEKVPDYALLTKNDEGVSVFDCYDNEEVHLDTINNLLSQGWVYKRDFVMEV